MKKRLLYSLLYGVVQAIILNTFLFLVTGKTIYLYLAPISFTIFLPAKYYLIFRDIKGQINANQEKRDKE